MQRVIAWLGMIIVATGCGEADGGAGGTGGSSLAEQRTYRLECTIDTLTLEIPIEARFEVDRPFREDSDTQLAFSAVVTFDEPAVAALIGAGVGTIDIVSIDLEAWVTGALAPSVATAFGDAPINDFDLTVDTDDNGAPGPHVLELDAQTVSTAARPGATEVELGIRVDQVSMQLGDFDVPGDCLNPTLVGLSARFVIER